MKNKAFRNLTFFTLLVAGSRIPFVFDGYGSEEDAWALPLVAERINLSGVYEVSRLPGHPLQELIYSSCWPMGSVFFNMLTLIISTLGILSFVLMLKEFNINNTYWTGAALAFTPIVYINSTNDMDYMWALSFVLICGYVISKRKVLPAGILLGLAVGCRITAGAMLLPFTIFIYMIHCREEKFRKCLQFSIAFFITALLTYLPVIWQYGFSFLDYYEHFPIPGFAKNFYKGSLAVWGLPGCILLLYLVARMIVKQQKVTSVIHCEKNITKAILICCIITVLLYLIAFIQVPLKAAFMIPLIPFLYLLLSLFATKKQHIAFTFSMLISCFFFGINLADGKRGSASSNAACTFEVSGQKVALDPLSGLVIADQSKKRQRSAYVNAVLEKTSTLHSRSIVISGWWLSEILVREKKQKNNFVSFSHYEDEAALILYKEKGYTIYYLEEQEKYNDLRFKKEMTTKYAIPLVIELPNNQRDSKR